MKERVLTGDRVTGKLHLGHYAGSLRNRVILQDQYESFVLLADVQALTTHFDRPELIRRHLREVALDYLAAGIDPEKATIFVQSMIPEIAELTVLFSMFVTVNVLRHNPTIKSESKNSGLDEMYYGFLGYPVSQAADIAFCKATIVPVGDDQLPHLELTRKIVRRFNELYKPVLVEPKPLVGEMPRLVGTDGNAKMSKSMGNSIPLDSSAEELVTLIKRAVTDPSRIHKNDPGHPDICPIYAYHRAFRPEGIPEIREGCEKGTMGCAACKGQLASALEQLLAPMRERRAFYEARPGSVDEILMSGTRRAREIARQTMQEVREAMSLDYFK
ncbi:tryptophan--tRNA ligase [Cohnella thailandensis]|uniref:Tryptophan--tRNA ligase n=1 Tax=Cohnella thailandensis TaxID=557557 RepID=A0A841SSW8_9BACL|nr:tryptophan--tRNA ligase [Cohnella thailandensis]MBB6633145.1 tryptophan--tRNA ligase [Cohnella thailandensis]MBP1975159.1 tryptophanyl-tRNA synthetase [Cohnella thailandensis]